MSGDGGNGFEASLVASQRTDRPNVVYSTSLMRANTDACSISSRGSAMSILWSHIYHAHVHEKPGHLLTLARLLGGRAGFTASR